jgi:hypothetical protein
MATALDEARYRYNRHGGGGVGAGQDDDEFGTRQQQQPQQQQQPPQHQFNPDSSTRSNKNVSFAAINATANAAHANAARSFLDVSWASGIAGDPRSIILDHGSGISRISRSSASLLLLEQVQEPGAISFIGQAVQDVLDVGLLARELLRVAHLFAEFNQGRFGGGGLGESGGTVAMTSWSSSTMYDTPQPIQLVDGDVDIDNDDYVEDPEQTKAIVQTMEWGILVAERMLEVQSLIEQHRRSKQQQRRQQQQQPEPTVYVAYAGMDKASGYLARLEEEAMTGGGCTIRFARDTTKLRNDNTRDPPASLLYNTCLSSPVVLLLLSWEATQETWPIAELFCALARQRRERAGTGGTGAPPKPPPPQHQRCQLVVDAYPGQVWLDVNAQSSTGTTTSSSPQQGSRPSPDRWRRDLQRLFPMDDFVQSAHWIAYTEASTDAHVRTVARAVAKIYRPILRRTRGRFWWLWGSQRR